MTIDLPTVLQRYFEAQNTHDIVAMVACFAPDAAVRDEGRDIRGAEAIRGWKKETSARYRIKAEPLECRIDCGDTVVVEGHGLFSRQPRQSHISLWLGRGRPDRHAGGALMGADREFIGRSLLSRGKCCVDPPVMSARCRQVDPSHVRI
jgi:hypothetical protein